MMKIAFTGSHSTGKTTLLNDLITYFDDDINIKCITEVARKIIDKGYPLNQDANVDSYVHYINDQLNEENIHMQGCDLFISDRTLLDPVAYSLVNRQLPRPYIPEYFIEMMTNVWLLEQARYDLYVYFPLEFPLEIDGIRPVDEKYRKDIDEKIHMLLMKYNINYITVSGNEMQRRDYLIKVIKKYMDKYRWL